MALSVILGDDHSPTRLLMAGAMSGAALWGGLCASANAIWPPLGYFVSTVFALLLVACLWHSLTENIPDHIRGEVPLLPLGALLAVLIGVTLGVPAYQAAAMSLAALAVISFDAALEKYQGT
jgi:hypothetical protein